ncbi:aminoglycoside 3-N-acetyltransferase I [Sphingomonas kaistensis]|uniref:Aminoglycoside 3-N-acetyltransferase I n=1 Tax=Sphingomonas kaistensis TaxID=298708 RepID=A0A7X5Y573_9SPHN|nr:aminoglycoside 3-N-acetyltransferase I [Sphingomonas kaistensis]
MEIVRLGSGDIARFRAMNLLFSAAFEDRDSYEGAPPPDDYVRERLADPRFIALVAVDGEAMLGALAAYELPKFEQARSELYIYDLAVDEAHRRRGIASALIAALQDHAAAIGAWMIFVQADPPDEPAVALYRKLGSEERVLHFDIAPAPAR